MAACGPFVDVDVVVVLVAVAVVAEWIVVGRRKVEKRRKEKSQKNVKNAAHCDDLLLIAVVVVEKC